MQILGIDIGGSGIKGAPVDVRTGELLAERMRMDTPRPARPPSILVALQAIQSHFGWEGPVGMGFPGVVRSGVVHTAVNLHEEWIDIDLAQRFHQHTGCFATVLNDADAAALGEAHYGGAAGVKGTVLMVTVGTGIGSALIFNGQLVPNTELGHILMKAGEAEKLLSQNVRKAENMSWSKWGKRFNKYLHYLHSLFWPELIVLGGGGTKKPERYLEFLDLPCKVEPARLGNRAGIAGAAFAASETLETVAPPA